MGKGGPVGYIIIIIFTSKKKTASLSLSILTPLAIAYTDTCPVAFSAFIHPTDKKKGGNSLQGYQHYLPTLPLHHACSNTPPIVIRFSTSRSSISRTKSILSSLMTQGTRKSWSMISSML